MTDLSRVQFATAVGTTSDYELAPTLGEGSGLLVIAASGSGVRYTVNASEVWWQMQLYIPEAEYPDIGSANFFWATAADESWIDYVYLTNTIPRKIWTAWTIEQARGVIFYDDWYTIDGYLGLVQSPGGYAVETQLWLNGDEVFPRENSYATQRQEVDADRIAHINMGIGYITGNGWIINKTGYGVAGRLWDGNPRVAYDTFGSHLTGELFGHWKLPS